jgi:ATP-dependent protease Clp ATPase subunit
MYEIPGRKDISKCLITAETIHNRTHPLLLTKTEHPVDWQEAEKTA